MIELLIGTYVPQIELLQTITKEPPAIVKVVEPTLQEKIASNYYKCDESLFWIRADNAQCLAKPIPTTQTVNNTTQTQKPVRGAVNASNSYEPGQCTWHVKNMAGWVGEWGNASSWASNAQADGYTLNSTPKIGAVAWRSGHVAYVVSLGNGTVVISEMNYNWVPYSQRTIEVPVDSYQYIY